MTRNDGAPVPFLLVPGFGCSGAVFADTVPALWPFGPVTLASTRGGENLEDVAAAILGHAPPRFGLLGFSMGGFLALEIIRQAPERVLGLCMLSSKARGDDTAEEQRRRALIAELEVLDEDAVLERMFPAEVEGERQADRRVRGFHRKMAAGLGKDRLIGQQRMILHRPDSLAAMANYRFPVAIIVGEEDRTTPPHESRAMAERVPDRKLTVVPGAGHFVLIEAAGRVNDALVAWAMRL